jgi:peptide chain release factor subunit 3
MEDVQKGFVLSSLPSPCPTGVLFRVNLYFVDTLEHRPIISRGYDCIMHLHTAEVEVTFRAIESVTDNKGQKVRNPFARQGQYCVAVLGTPLQTCMEIYENQPALGRLTLRDEGKTIAIGKVVEVIR